MLFVEQSDAGYRLAHFASDLFTQRREYGIAS